MDAHQTAPGGDEDVTMECFGFGFGASGTVVKHWDWIRHVPARSSCLEYSEDR